MRYQIEFTNIDISAYNNYILTEQTLIAPTKFDFKTTSKIGYISVEKRFGKWTITELPSHLMFPGLTTF